MGSEVQGAESNKLLCEMDSKSLQKERPFGFHKGIQIKTNSATGLLEGFPEEWKNYKLAHNVDQEKRVNYNKLPQHIRPVTDLPDKVLAMMKEPIISKPMNVKHQIHMEIDSKEPYGIKGIPKEWLAMFEKQERLKEISRENPQVLIQIVSNFQNKTEYKNKLLSKEEFIDVILKIEIIKADPSLKYKFQHQLGKGAMCRVYMCRPRKNPDLQFGCRIMKMSSDPLLFEKVKTEIAVMKICNHRTIVHYQESFIYQNCIFMLVEYMNGGSLTDFIYKYSNNIPQHIIAYISRQIFLALAEMHSHSQIHRDLKSDNVLVKRDGSVKLADFGFATQLTQEKTWRKSQVGTPAWMAPQLIRKRDYNEKVDIWSGGMIVYELAETEPPFLRFAPNTCMYKICQQDAPRLSRQQYSEQLCDFIERCMQKNPQNRWSASQLLNHKFLAQAKDSASKKLQFSQMICRPKS